MKQLLDQLTAEHVIFDLDGTLIDSAPAILESFRIAFEEFSVKPVVPLTASLIGPPLIETLAKIAGTSDPGVLESLAEAFKNNYDNHGYKNTIYFDGVPDLLVTLKSRGQALYIATNKREKPTAKIIEHLNLGGFFRSVYSLDSFDPALLEKSELLQKLIEEHKLPRGKVSYVGDRHEDTLAAIRAGMYCVKVDWGYDECSPLRKVYSKT